VDLHAEGLSDSGREDEPVDGGVPAWWLYLDKPQQVMFQDSD